MDNIGTQEIDTDRLVLRRFVEGDVNDAFINWAGDEIVQNDYCEPVYESVEDTLELVNKYIASYEKLDYYRWAIDLKEGTRCVGQIAFFLVDSKNLFGEIEYCIGRRFQNRGYVTEAVKAVIKFGFEKIGFNRIQISHRNTNMASKRVIEKCGFQYEGNLRQFFYHEGSFIDRLYYSILKDEWQHMKF